MGFRAGGRANWWTERFLKMRIADQIKLVRKPPQRTTTRTGRFCQRSRRLFAKGAALAMRAMGAPAARPKAKKLLMRPAKMATAMPLGKEKSRSPVSAFFCGVTSRFLGVAGGSVDGYGDEADEDAGEDDLAGGLVGDGGDLCRE